MHFIIMYYFMLAYQIKSLENTSKHVVISWQNVEEVQTVEYWRYCNTTKWVTFVFICAYVSSEPLGLCDALWPLQGVCPSVQAMLVSQISRKPQTEQ